MIEDIERINHPKMEFYRETYKNSKRWDGDSFDGKNIIIYMEQGLGDQIMFFRFIKYFDKSKIILHTSKELHPIFENIGYKCLDKNCEDLPDHDFHILSLSLPFVLNCSIPLEPYIEISEKTELIKGFNIGIAWEGNPLHQYNSYRNCPLKYFKILQKEGINLFSLQPVIHDQNLIMDCEDLYLNGVEINNFYDTAKLINSLDMVISVDTGVLHLAGAMGKNGFGILSPVHTDYRWNFIWYPSIKMLKGSWNGIFMNLSPAIQTIIEKI